MWTIVASLVSFLAALVCAVFSTWFRGLHSIIQCITCLFGILYSAVVSYAYMSWRDSESYEYVPFLVQTFVYAVLIWLSEIFVDIYSDPFTLVATVLGATHFFLASQAFKITEDYGLTLGLLTLCVAIAMKLTTNYVYKMFIIAVGAFLLAVYSHLKKKRHEQREMALVQNLERELNMFRIRVDALETKPRDSDLDAPPNMQELQIVLFVREEKKLSVRKRKRNVSPGGKEGGNKKVRKH